LLDEYQQADEIFSWWPSTIPRCSASRGLMLFELPFLFLQLTGSQTAGGMKAYFA